MHVICTLHVIVWNVLEVCLVLHLTWCQIMDKLTPPESLRLDGKITDNWTRWKQHNEIFSLASGLSRKDAKIQAATFLHVAGVDALEVYNTFTWENAKDKSKVDKIMENINSYCIPRKNVTWEQHVFNTCKQHVGKTIDQYVTDLQTKAQTCEFTELKDSLIRDRIVCGITCDKTRSRLLKESDLTFQKTLDICRANGATVTRLESFGASNPTTEHDIHQIQMRQASELRRYTCDKYGTQHSRHQT